MPRIHAPEIEDEPWLPRVIRDALTGFLQISAEALHVYDAAAPVIADVAHRHRATRLVDLCSGGGGPVVRLRRLLERRGVDVDVVLTDLFPNLDAFAAAHARDPRIVGRTVPVDAADVPVDLDGVRTIINGLHHLRPALARRLLADAAKKGQPIVVVEVVERRFVTMAVLMGTPVLALVLSPWQRPLSVLRLLLTWVVPIVPLLIWWDGMMSCLRAYDVDELRALCADLDDARYTFRIEQVPTPWLPLRLTMLVGEPQRSSP